MQVERVWLIHMNFECSSGKNRVTQLELSSLQFCYLRTKTSSFEFGSIVLQPKTARFKDSSDLSQLVIYFISVKLLSANWIWMVVLKHSDICNHKSCLSTNCIQQNCNSSWVITDEVNRIFNLKVEWKVEWNLMKYSLIFFFKHSWMLLDRASSTYLDTRTHICTYIIRMKADRSK